MLDPKLFRTDLDYVQQQMARRRFEFKSEQYTELENRRKQLQVNTQGLQNQRKKNAKVIGQAKAKGEDIQPLLDAVQDLGEQLKAAETELQKLLAEMNAILEGMPNILDAEVPDGKSEDDNVEIFIWGELPEFDFEVKDHVDLGAGLSGIDFELAAKISGARFSVLKGQVAGLQRAIIQFMLDTHIREHGYTETYVPFLVNADSLRGTGQLPKFAADLFKVENDPPFYLIPTAEVPVTNIARDMIVADTDMPLKFVSHTPCFRSEAGAYGADVRGMIRQHQFEKVELVQVVKPEDSMQALDELTSHAEKVLQLLELPYQVLTLCTGDMGFSAVKTHDLEVWLPGQNQYREVSSCSNTRDFQARRMQARFRDPESSKPALVHTLNGSGMAVGRTMIAVMENYQDEDGNIHVPEVLQPYMGGMKILA